MLNTIRAFLLVALAIPLSAQTPAAPPQAAAAEGSSTGCQRSGTSSAAAL